MKSVKILTKVDLISKEYKICEFPTQKPIRRSIDDYNDKLLLKSMHKKDPLDIDPRLSQHSSVKKIREKPLSLGKSGLTIIGTSHQSQILTQRKPEKKTTKSIILRNSTSSFSKRLSQNLQLGQDYSQQENPFLLAYSSKIKLLHSMPRKKNVFLVLPAEFLLDESNFWREEEPEDAAARVWRKLTNIANIVWLVQKEKTYKKLVEYCERMGLPLDAVYLIEPRKNKITLTVNFRAMKTDLSLTGTNKLIFFSLLKECQCINSFKVLQNQLPLIEHRSVYVHLMKVKTSGVAAFPHVTEILKKQPQESVYLKPLWEEYTNYTWELERGRGYRRVVAFCEDQEDWNQKEEVSTLDRIQRLKKEWTDWIMKMRAMSLKPLLADGDSVPFIVGDLLRRNYPLLDKFYKREHSRQGRPSLPASRSQYRPASLAIPQHPISYSIPIFVWNL